MAAVYDIWPEQDPDAISEGELGHVTFEEWYHLPLFEPDHAERLEAAATSGRGPARLFASVLLRLQAHRRPPEKIDAPQRRLRGRAASFLDHWAEQEVRTQALLEKRLLPPRWRA